MTRKRLCHRRPALCQRPHPYWPSGRVFADRHLGPVPKAPRAAVHLHLCRRHARHGHHDPRPAGGHRRGGADRQDAQAHVTDFRRLRHRVRQLRQHEQPGNAGSLRRDLGGPPQSRTGRQAGGHATLRRPGRHVSGRPLRQRDLPEVQVARPVRRQLRQVRLPLQPDRADRSGQHAFGHDAGIREADHLFVNIEKLHDFLEDWTQSGEHLQPEIANYLARPLPRRAVARLGCLAAGALLRLRDSRQPGQLLVRLVRRADRLHRLDEQWCETHGEQFDDWWRNPETEIHHFIGKDITYFHTLFWPAMLQDGRLQSAQRRSTSTAF